MNTLNTYEAQNNADGIDKKYDNNSWKPHALDVGIANPKYCLQIESNPSKYHLPVFFRLL